MPPFEISETLMTHCVKTKTDKNQIKEANAVYFSSRILPFKNKSQAEPEHERANMAE
jgi:hypothetical protein